MKRRISPWIPSLCPYLDCQAHTRGAPSGPISRRLIRRGRYFRVEDSRWISRFLCPRCRRSFSSSRFSPCFRQKKRRLNLSVRALLSSGCSQRRMARLLQIDRKTVVRKFLFIAQQAKRERLQSLEDLRRGDLITRVQFDEMESFEHSKCLPLSIPLVVEAGSRKILGFRVGRMPAKGLLAQISRKKYGPRKDDRPKMARDLFSELSSVIDSKAHFTTDQNPKYPSWLRPHFPEITHRAVKGRRGCTVGQGELKRIGFDPLFSLNHTAAMIRANVNRLFRKRGAPPRSENGLRPILRSMCSIIIRY